jgi:hypothetical protein
VRRAWHNLSLLRHHVACLLGKSEARRILFAWLCETRYDIGKARQWSSDNAGVRERELLLVDPFSCSCFRVEERERVEKQKAQNDVSTAAKYRRAEKHPQFSLV